MSKQPKVSQEHLDKAERNRTREGLIVMTPDNVSVFNFERMRYVHVDTDTWHVNGGMILAYSTDDGEKHLFQVSESGDICVKVSAPHDFSKYSQLPIGVDPGEALVKPGTTAYAFAYTDEKLPFNLAVFSSNEHFIMLRMAKGRGVIVEWPGMGSQKFKAERRVGSFIDLREPMNPKLRMEGGKTNFIPDALAIQVLAWERRQREPKPGDEMKLLKLN